MYEFKPGRYPLIYVANYSYSYRSEHDLPGAYPARLAEAATLRDLVAKLHEMQKTNAAEFDITVWTTERPEGKLKDSLPIGVPPDNYAVQTESGRSLLPTLSVPEHWMLRYVHAYFALCDSRGYYVEAPTLDVLVERLHQLALGPKELAALYVGARLANDTAPGSDTISDDVVRVPVDYYAEPRSEREDDVDDESADELVLNTEVTDHWLFADMVCQERKLRKLE